MPRLTGKRPNDALRKERLRHRWSQQEVADRIGTTPNNVSRWELGVTRPGPYFRDKLCELFGLSRQELWNFLENGKIEPTKSPLQSRNDPYTSETGRMQLWHIPYRRNPFFTGREDILRYLHEALQQGENIALTQALSGLGGIGKTQTAIEYAYRHRQLYRAVLWLSASNEQELHSSIAVLAEVLHPDESQQERDQQRTITMVQRWLREHDGWLLIVDNVEEMSPLASVLPPLCHGQILLTTRNQVTGTFAHGLPLPVLSDKEGAALLLRRAKRIGQTGDVVDTEESELACAMEITQLMGGLPLALDQAAAYVEETACSLQDYLQTYRRWQATLLKRRGTESADHPLSVMATFVLAFTRIEQLDPVAADLLRFCAFLHPVAIPEDLLKAAAPVLGPLLQSLASDSLYLETRIGVLRRFSLLDRHPETKTLAVHRLVQVVLRDSMDEQMRLRWVERTVLGVNRAFPTTVGDPANWMQCQQLLPHALACQQHIQHEQFISEAGEQLLSRAGSYLVVRGQYDQAEPLLLQTHHLCTRRLGEDHPEYAACLHRLGMLRFYQGRYGQAAHLFQKALTIQERHLPAEHPAILESISDLAITLQEQGRYKEAARHLQHILMVTEHIYGPLHLAVAEALKNLAIVLRQLSRYDEALPMLRRAFSIYEQSETSSNESMAYCQEQIGSLLRDYGQDEAALPYFQRALALFEQAYGPQDLHIARGLYVLGSHLRKMGRYDQAFPLLSQALTIREQILGPNHLLSAVSLESLGLYFLDQEQWSQAEQLLQRALTILEQGLGTQHPNVGITVSHLANLYAAQQQYSRAEPLYLQAITILEQELGGRHPVLMNCIEGYAMLLRQTDRPQQATRYDLQRKRIKAKFASQRVRSVVGGTSCFPQNGAPLTDFLAECCKLHPQASSRTDELWRTYLQWVAKHGNTELLSRRAFAQQLIEHGCHPSRTKNSRLWRGIELKQGREGDVVTPCLE